jgi:hypothetical protein
MYHSRGDLHCVVVPDVLRDVLHVVPSHAGCVTGVDVASDFLSIVLRDVLSVVVDDIEGDVRCVTGRVEESRVAGQARNQAEGHGRNRAGNHVRGEALNL